MPPSHPPSFALTRPLPHPLLLLFLCPLLAPVLVEGLDNGLARRPTLGWNTWMTCDDTACVHDQCSEKMVKEAANAMIENGMQAMGYNYVNLDDCWADIRNETDGSLRWDPKRFPSGIPALVNWLHAKGFKFGLYTSAGNMTCSSGGRPYKIPGSEGHYEQDAKTFASWGVDFVKLDWCGDYKKMPLKGPKAHKDFAKAMNESGRTMFLDVVAGYFFLGRSITDYSNSWRFCEDHHDSWSSVKEQVLCRLDQKLLGVRGAPGGWANMDFLQTGGKGCDTPLSHCPQMTDAEYRTEFSIWSITQSPLIVDTDVRNLTGIMKSALLNKEIIDIHQSTETPPGDFIDFHLCSEPEVCFIWGRKLSNTSWLIALSNFSTKNETHKIRADFSHFGWGKDIRATARDLWAHKDLGQTPAGYFESDVRSHDTVMVVLNSL